MNKAFVIPAVLLLTPFPAFSQAAPGGEGRDYSYSRRDRDLEDILRGIGDHGREGPRRGGASFFLRSGDATLAVRCDPQDSMKSCVDATLHAVGPGPFDAAVRRRAGRYFPGDSLVRDGGSDSLAAFAGARSL